MKVPSDAVGGQGIGEEPVDTRIIWRSRWRLPQATARLCNAQGRGSNRGLSQLEVDGGNGAGGVGLRGPGDLVRNPVQQGERHRVRAAGRAKLGLFIIETKEEELRDVPSCVQGHQDDPEMHLVLLVDIDAAELEFGTTQAACLAIEKGDPGPVCIPCSSARNARAGRRADISGPSSCTCFEHAALQAHLRAVVDEPE